LEGEQGLLAEQAAPGGGEGDGLLSDVPHLGALIHGEGGGAGVDGPGSDPVKVSGAEAAGEGTEGAGDGRDKDSRAARSSVGMALPRLAARRRIPAAALGDIEYP